eukprot:1656610-Amphidinium_carterae.1
MSSELSGAGGKVLYGSAPIESGKRSFEDSLDSHPSGQLEAELTRGCVPLPFWIRIWMLCAMAVAQTLRG